MKKCPQCGVEYADSVSLCTADGSALESSADPLVGDTLAGKYRIEERLSVGGMGAVYRATHVLMDKKVAVKVLRPSLAADPIIVARFSREARAASRINHPNALSVTDFGEAEGGVVFLVMEFLNGRTLKDEIRRQGPLPLPRVVEIVKQIGSALEAAHAEGIIHRDLKSDNIMLLDTNGADYAKVLDFGIAKIRQPAGGTDPGLTSPDLVIGTPQYMSPEQCSQAEELDARSDIYSLGVILYEMLVGRVPFTGDSPTVVMFKQVQQPPPSVLAARPDLPTGVGVVVSRALAKQPQDRYQRVGELVEDLLIAAGTGMVGQGEQQRVGAFGTAADQVPSSRHDRIVIPTGPGALDSIDENTLVHPRATPPYGAPPAAPSRFSPWRIIIPTVAGMLVVFAVIYAFTRNEQSGQNANRGATLTTDPNSQPVQPASPATGRPEQGIPGGGAATEGAGANLNVNVNANVAAGPSPAGNANANLAPSENRNANANRNPELPSPAPPKATPEPSAPRPSPVVSPSGTPPPAA